MNNRTIIKYYLKLIEMKKTLKKYVILGENYKLPSSVRFIEMEHGIYQKQQFNFVPHQLTIIWPCICNNKNSGSDAKNYCNLDDAAGGVCNTKFSFKSRQNSTLSGYYFYIFFIDVLSLLFHFRVLNIYRVYQYA